MKEKLAELNKSFSNSLPEEILGYFLKNHKGKIALGSSLGAEDQVLTDMIAKIDKSAKIFTLDTGRLFPETYNLIEKTNRKYGINIDVYFPDKEMVEKIVKEKGINLFYESIENRKLCCHIRKVVPLQRALEGVEVWITGIRKDQTITRFFNKHVELDEVSKIIKVNPLLSWTEKDVWEYISKYDVPYNELHDKGFPSIGCQPCTRAVNSGEDIRGGRWWWEQPEQKECGLHNRNK
ncbi:MAG: phosphoadenylyl-sulfate reductase [Bacteroidales bacterium]